MHENLDKLRALTDKLPIISHLDDIAIPQTDRSMLYQVEKGAPIQAWCLHNDERSAVVLSHLQKGSKIKKHFHKPPIKEWLIVISGEIKLYNGSIEGQIVKEQEAVVFQSSQAHRVEALQDT